VPKSTVSGSPLGRLWRIATLALALATYVGPAEAQSQPRRTVLVIHWSPEEFPINPRRDAAIREVLLAPPDPIDYFAEYLESDRFAEPQASRSLRDYVQEKYQGRRIDLVVAVTDVALQFVLLYRHDLFPSAPIVFAGFFPPAAEIRRTDPGITGAVMAEGYEETLALALRLHPSVTQVFVVAKWPELRFDSLQGDLRQFESRARITYLTKEPLSDVLNAVRAAPRDSLILFIRYADDSSGPTNDEAARMVAEAAPVPVYCVAESNIGSGVVGGAVLSPETVGKRVGEIGRRILHGTRPQEIPIEGTAVTPTFDWRQLRRWNIAESRLPAASLVLNRELPAWRRYFWTVVTTVLLVMAQGGIIGALLVQRRNRRRFEVALRESEEKARASYDEVRDLAGRLISAREGERARIARDLHDDIGQRVASVSIAVSRIQRQIPDVASPARQSLSDLEHQSMQLSADLRHLSHELHPGALEHLGLLEALRERCDDFSHESGVPVQLAVSEAWRDVSDAPALCLYRVAQEALRNVATHARARNVTVLLDRLDGHLMMQVTDDGCGFDPTAPSRRPGLGLVSLSERVRMLGGQLVVTAAPDAGTCIAVKLPIGESHAP
jgi:signal transduction histidine kinase/ABC-type uncharacterized transport system substrate-binding protein